MATLTITAPISGGQYPVGEPVEVQGWIDSGSISGVTVTFTPPSTGTWERTPGGDSQFFQGNLTDLSVGDHTVTFKVTYHAGGGGGGDDPPIYPKTVPDPIAGIRDLAALDPTEPPETTSDLIPTVAQTATATATVRFSVVSPDLTPWGSLKNVGPNGGTWPKPNAGARLTISGAIEAKNVADSDLRVQVTVGAGTYTAVIERRGSSLSFNVAVDAPVGKLTYTVVLEARRGETWISLHRFEGSVLVVAPNPPQWGDAISITAPGHDTLFQVPPGSAPGAETVPVEITLAFDPSLTVEDNPSSVEEFAFGGVELLVDERLIGSVGADQPDTRSLRVSSELSPGPTGQRRARIVARLLQRFRSREPGSSPDWRVSTYASDEVWITLAWPAAAALDLRYLAASQWLPLAGALIPSGAAAAQLTVRASGPGPRGYASLALHTDLADTALALRFEPAEPGETYTGTLTIPAALAPATIAFGLRGRDWWDAKQSAAAGFLNIIDTTAPTVVIDRPRPAEVIPFERKVSATSTVVVTLAGRVSDVQSGFEPGTLRCSFAGRTFPITDVAPDQAGVTWTCALRIDRVGPYKALVSARDRAGNEVTAVVDFTVTSIYRPKTLDELLDAGAYLDELLRLCRDELRTGLGDDAPAVDPIVLFGAFGQTFGEIAEADADAAERPVSDLLLPVRTLRSQRRDDNAVADYLQHAYETLLRGVGTSFEELRAVRTLDLLDPNQPPTAGRPRQEALADRLGLPRDLDLTELLPPHLRLPQTAAAAGWIEIPGYSRGDGVAVRGYRRARPDAYRWNNYGRSARTDELLAPERRDADRDGLPNFLDIDDDNDGVPDDRDHPDFAAELDRFEHWLAETFGLPPTTAAGDVPAAAARLLVLQRERLTALWADEDAGRKLPDLDPDLVDSADLDATAKQWLDLLAKRSAALDTQFALYRSQMAPGGALEDALGADDLRSVVELAAADARGEPIESAVAELDLDLPMFRRLLAYHRLTEANEVLSAAEREDLAHLLVEVWKRRQAAAWLAEERARPTRLWPSDGDSGAWVTGGYRAGFLPWRGSSLRRSELEARLNGRHRVWQSLMLAAERAVAEAQRAALPGLRDALLGLVGKPMEETQEIIDDASERWLVDFGASSATFLTPVDQAIASIQTLLNGVRGGWFEGDHPAKSWAIAGTDKTSFDDKWLWLQSYDRWRSAVMNWLYPENVLYPELRKGTNEFKTFLSALSGLQPITKGVLDAALGEGQGAVLRNPWKALPATADGDAERFYFAFVAIALALQRAGDPAGALDWYRRIFNPSTSGRIERVKPKLDDWMRADIPDHSSDLIQGLDVRLGHSPLVKEAPRVKEDEAVLAPPKIAFPGDWPTKLETPHAIAGISGCSNPYTRFTLFQILHCLLDQADDAFADGTRDGRTKALGLYIEANDILRFAELKDVQPTDESQVYLPSALLAGLRSRTFSALSKLRRGLSYLGTPLPPDLTRGPGQATLSSLVRPTPYRYRVLMERAKQLVAIAQQMEGQYLSAIERQESEMEKILNQEGVFAVAEQTVALRDLAVTEAEHGKALAWEQRNRASIEQQRYSNWISSGPNQQEREQLSLIDASSVLRQAQNQYQAAASILSLSGQAAGSFMESFGVASALYAGAAIFTGAASTAQAGLIELERESQRASILAGQARRNDEWELRRDLAAQDTVIAEQQVELATNRIAIAESEKVIAETQAANARQMLAFLTTEKFTTAAFYEWLAGVLAEVFAFFLRLAAATASQGEQQLAFERQEPPQRLIRADYWRLASSGTGSGTGGDQDRRGITGSARLLQDLYSLDQYAFSSERRLLNLTQSFSLDRLMPVELNELRRTGVLVFATPMAWFDEGFPGHYLRLIKRVRVSIAALIPPSLGIRATLSNGGLSRVVTADPGYPTMVIRQDPQSVALTSPTAATGVFELDMQSDLLFPFEGTGVDTTWFLELPRAANPFDFDSLMDVVISLDYTALFSADLRERVIKTLPREAGGDRVISVRRDLPDVWYEIANGTGDPVRVVLSMDRRQFPPGIDDIEVRELAISARTTAGAPCRFAVTPSVTQEGVTHTAAQVTATGGIASSRQSAAAAWRSALLPRRGDTTWTFEITDDDPNAGTEPDGSILRQLRDGTVEDILLIFGFAGRRPAWPSA